MGEIQQSAKQTKVPGFLKFVVWGKLYKMVDAMEENKSGKEFAA